MRMNSRHLIKPKDAQNPLAKFQIMFNFVNILLCIFFQPIWYRNDDLVIAFLSKGLGYSDNPIYTIYDTNIILNYLYSIIPNIFNILSYSIVQYALIFISINIILQKILINSAKKIVTTILFTMITLPTLLYPTFTLTAAWVTIASLMICRQAIKERHHWKLVFGTLFLIVSSLIRDEVTLVIFLIFLISLYINKEQIEFSRTQIGIIIVTLIAVFITQYINRNAYSSEQFQFGQNFAKNVSYPINDYGADILLENNPQIINKYGYSINDIKLIRNYFNVDRNLVEPLKISKILDELGWQNSILHFNQERIIDQVKGILDKNVYGFYTLLLLLIMLFGNNGQSRKFLALAFIIIMILLLRGRIEGFVTFFIVLSSVLFQKSYFDFKGKVVPLIVLTLSIGLTFYTTNLHFQRMEDSKVASESFKKMENKDFWNWGGSFPTQLIYPVFDSRNWKKDIRINDMGWSTYIPGTNSFISLNNDGFISELNSVNGVNFSAINFHIPLLERYCFEHFGSKLQLITTNNQPFITIYNAKCSSERINFVSDKIEFTDESSFIWFTDENKEIKINNSTGKKLAGNIIFSVRKGPCKNQIEDSKLTFQNNTIGLSSAQQAYSMEVRLDPYQSEIMQLDTAGSDFCETAGDDRKLHSQLTNFSFEESSS
jgi:hypothetical protein